MSHFYNIKLSLAIPNPSITLLEKEEVLDKAIQEYNNRTFQMQNPKKIEKISLENAILNIRLESALPLNSVGRALRTFSTIIIKEFKDSDFIAQITPNGQLFATINSSEDVCENNSVDRVDVNSVDDLDIVKSLLDYICNKREQNSTEYRKKRAAMNNIKQIAIDSGIYKVK